MANQNQDPALQTLPDEYVEEGDVIIANSGTNVPQKPNEDLAKADQLRETLANVYTFVRSQEINRVIGGFTFDHYIDEAKNRLKGPGRSLLDAAGQVISSDQTVGSRPSQLEYLSIIQTRFNNSYQELLKQAKKADQ